MTGTLTRSLDGRPRTCPHCAAMERRVLELSARLGQAGLEPAASELDDGAGAAVDPGLTPREYEIGSLVAQGKSNREIADTLYLGVNSVKTHLLGLYRKIGVHNRTQAALWFERVRPADPTA